MDKYTSKTSSKLSLQKKPSAARNQTAQRFAAAEKSRDQSSTKKETSDLPVFSGLLPIKKTASKLEKHRKKTIRRDAPPGEDIEHINQILRLLEQQSITVQEFVPLIGPSTGDRGETMRVVMNDDLNAFRNLCREVYATTVQDNSDVMLNEQLQLTEYYKEKKNYYHFKMMAAFRDIFGIVPNFNFDRYAVEKEHYLLELFSVPQKVSMDFEKVEMLKRQTAYHRLQWLYSEEERLAEENNSLKQRLEELKQLYLKIQTQRAYMEEDAEKKCQTLEAEETKREEELEQLNQSLKLSLVQQEILLMKDDEKKKYGSTQKQGAVRKTVLPSHDVKKVSKPLWHEQVAKKIEEKQFENCQQSENVKLTLPFHCSLVQSPGSVMSPINQYEKRVTTTPAKDQWNDLY